MKYFEGPRKGFQRRDSAQGKVPAEFFPEPAPNKTRIVGYVGQGGVGWMRVGVGVVYGPREEERQWVIG